MSLLNHICNQFVLKIFILGIILNFIPVFLVASNVKRVSGTTSQAKNIEQNIFITPLDINSNLDSYISSLTLEQKVGQLFIIGFSGSSLTSELENFIVNNKVGSVVLFKRNISSLFQTQKLTNEIKTLIVKNTGVIPFVAIDQEGGFVSRIPFFPQIPSAYSLGLSSNPVISETIGYEVGKGISSLGFNFNFAPVLDVIDSGSESFVGHRSFGVSPDLVSSMGVSFSNGLLRSGVIPTAKHFPGIGSISADPHKTHISLDILLSEFESKHLVPFQNYIKLGDSSAIMISHLSYPNLDSSNTPASFSKPIITGLLRQRLGFDGIVITDDLQMDGAKNIASPEKAAVLSLKAGSDMIMLTWSLTDQLKSISYVLNSYKSGELDMPSLNSKVKRILKSKLFLMKNQRDFQLSLSEKSKYLSSASLRKSIDAALEKNLDNYRSELAKITNLSASRNVASAIEKNHGLVNTLSSASAFAAAEKQICLFSNSNQFNSSFLSVIADAKILSFDSLHLKSVDSVLSRCKINLVVTPNSTSLSNLNHLEKKIKSQLILVNLSALAINPPKDKNDYKLVLSLNFSYLNAGKKIAEILKSLNVSSLINQERLLIDRFRALSLPTQNQTTFE